MDRNLEKKKKINEKIETTSTIASYVLETEKGVNSKAILAVYVYDLIIAIDGMYRTMTCGQ